MLKVSDCYLSPEVFKSTDLELPVKSNSTPNVMIRRPCGVVKYRYWWPMYSKAPVAGLRICTLLVTYLSPQTLLKLEYVS
jgi:hypothetical protein